MGIAARPRESVLEHGLVLSLEWRSVVSSHHNLLAEGPEEWTEALLSHLTPLLDAPVIWATSHALGELPAGHCGALVLKDVASLRRDDQRQLLEWLDDGRHVISTTVEPLFPLVVRGSFDEALYYRLNVIRLNGPLADTAMPPRAQESLS